MDKQKVLFACVHNSARSQMAEAFLKQLAGDKFDVESAGLEPGKLNPIVVEVMKEIGVDISGNKTQSVFELFREGRLFHYVITVCEESQSDKCPIFPSALEKIHWNFNDPSKFMGTHEEKLKNTRDVRDAIRRKIEEWIDTK